VISKFYALPDGEVIGRSYIRKSGKFAALPVFWEAAATGVEISVDEETGKITMEKLATVGDVGLGDQSALAKAKTSARDDGNGHRAVRRTSLRRLAA
jgi:hypothetical protein